MERSIVAFVADDIRHDIKGVKAALSGAASAPGFPGAGPGARHWQAAGVLNTGVQLTDNSTFLAIGADGFVGGLPNGQKSHAVSFGDQDSFVFQSANSDMDPGSSNRVFETVDRGGGTVAFLAAAGHPVVQSPPVAGGTRVRQDPSLRPAFNGAYTNVAEIEGRPQLAADRAIDAFPFVVGYGQAIRGMFAGWSGIALVIGATAIAACGFQLFLMREMALARRRQAAADQELVLRIATLSEVNKDLEAKLRREMQSRQEAQQKLAKSQRLEALGQLAGGIAHDINNVMQTVSGACSLLQQYHPDRGDIQRLTAIALSAADRGRAVTQRLLMFARPSAIKAELVEIGPVLHDLGDLLSHTLCDHVALELDLADNLPLICADRMQLETVIINLATNARDAMPDGGVITLRAQVETVNAVSGGGLGLPPGRYVHLGVSDTGIGMDETIRARAAEPFFSTKDVGKGTGLGLSMAKGFAEQLNGKLEIMSKVGQGTTINIWVPAEADARRGDRGVPDRDSSHPGGEAGIRLLIVDDNAPARELMGEALAEDGFAVHEAESAPAALAMIKDGLEVDLLLTDLSMPEMDGLQLIRAIRTFQPDLPAILLTGHTGAVADLAADLPVDAPNSVLQKPIRMQKLLEHIRTLLQRANVPSMSG